MSKELIYLSIIVPVCNEEENVLPLHDSICAVQELPTSCEIIYVDDGSTDTTFARLCALSPCDMPVKIIRLRRNYGQTAALAAGIAHSSGSVLVFMDGDLQNDPHDIPRLLTRLEEGYDLVSGWRKDRRDARLSRNLPSWLANRLIARVSGVPLHDFGCTLKVYRRDIFAHLQLYGEMHRLLPAYAALTGATIAELPVKHHARRAGRSKYGLSRTLRVLLDLLTFKMQSRYATRPSHAIGLPGLLWLLCSILLVVGGLSNKLLPTRWQFRLPSWSLLTLQCLAAGLLSLSLGLMAEALMRSYYEVLQRPPYIVAEVRAAAPQPKTAQSTIMRETEPVIL